MLYQVVIDGVVFKTLNKKEHAVSLALQESKRRHTKDIEIKELICYTC